MIRVTLVNTLTATKVGFADFDRVPCIGERVIDPRLGGSTFVNDVVHTVVTGQCLTEVHVGYLYHLKSSLRDRGFIDR